MSVAYGEICFNQLVVEQSFLFGQINAWKETFLDRWGEHFFKGIFKGFSWAILYGDDMI